MPFTLLTKYIQIITNKRYPESSHGGSAVQYFQDVLMEILISIFFWWQVKPLVVYDGMKGSLIFWSIFSCLCDNLIKGPVQRIMMTDNAINLKTDTVISITCKLSQPCNLHNQLSPFSFQNAFLLQHFGYINIPFSL